MELEEVAREADERLRRALASLEQRINEQRGKEQAAAAQKAATAGNAYLAENAKKEGVKTTASGLQYRMVQEGTGRIPAATDTVTVNYKGKLVDGTVFDASSKHGGPATFPLGGVIPCWTEGVQKIKVGGKARLVCPAAIAYGDRGAGGGGFEIPPDAGGCAAQLHGAPHCAGRPWHF